MEPPTTTTCGFRPEFCFATSSKFATLRVTEEVALLLSGLNNRKTGQVVTLGKWAWDNSSDVYGTQIQYLRNSAIEAAEK